MKKLMICVMVGLGLTACDQVKTASTIITMDKELVELYRSKGKADVVSSKDGPIGMEPGTKLRVLADRAKKNAGVSELPPLEALSYNRIAITAYWQSGFPDAFAEVLNLSKKAIDLCKSLGNSAPERDCFYVQMARPLAAAEQSAAKLLAKPSDEQRLFQQVTLEDGLSPQEKKAVEDSVEAVAGIRQNVLELFALGNSDVPGNMKAYYCHEVKELYQGYTGDRSKLSTLLNSDRLRQQWKADFGEEALRAPAAITALPAKCA